MLYTIGKYYKISKKKKSRYFFLLFYVYIFFSPLTVLPFTTLLAESSQYLAKYQASELGYNHINSDWFLSNSDLKNENSTHNMTMPSNRMKNNDNFTDSISYNYAEKIYLQLDGKVYTTGNTIWFKAIVLRAQNHVPSTLSGVLNVELISSGKKILEKKLIKLENGIGQGFFELDAFYQEGTYLVRAYTNWNKNFGADFFFEEYIQVFNDKKKLKPINNINLIKEESNINLLEASFYPLEIDSLHKSKLKILVTLDNKEDSLYLKKEKDNMYQLDYKFPVESQFVKLQMETENNLKYAKTIVLNEEYIDLQFLPESGELVHGLSSKVGFKALDAQGKGKLIQGDIVDEHDSLMASFKSNSLGMGSFILNNPDSLKRYYARIKTNWQTLLYPLPDVAPTGNVLSIVKQDENILITAQSSYLNNDSIYLDVFCRGVRLYQIKAVLTYFGTYKLMMPSKKLPEGIISFTMMDHAGHPIAQRIYFNQRPESRVNIHLTANKVHYKQRELTHLTIETTDFDDQPLPANLSLLVINKQQLGEIQHQRQNILTYFLLDSELKGEIENPGFYFNLDSSMHHHLDALMLTQGWRKYKYFKEKVGLTYLPETKLSLTGNVSSVFSRKKKKPAKVTLMTFGSNASVYTQVADSLGNFKFDLNDVYGQKVNILIQSAKLSGKKMNYNVHLDKKESPLVYFDMAKTVVELDSGLDNFVSKDIQRNKIEDAFSPQSGSFLLDEVEVTGYKLTPEREKVLVEYGETDVLIDGNSIQEEEQKWSTGLYHVLKMSFPEKIQIVRRSDGTLYAKAHNDLMNFFVVDGTPMMLWEYSLIPNIPPSEVISVEIIEYANNVKDIFCKLYPPSCAYAPEQGNIIAIYTRGGKGLYGATKPVGIVRTAIPVFSAPREFYTPKYDNSQSNDLNNKPDLRALINWEPELKTDTGGRATASFYNADNVGKVIVVVEAVSANGAIGYQEIEYEIEGKEVIIFGN